MSAKIDNTSIVYNKKIFQTPKLIYVSRLYLFNISSTTGKYENVLVVCVSRDGFCDDGQQRKNQFLRTTLIQITGIPRETFSMGQNIQVLQKKKKFFVLKFLPYHQSSLDTHLGRIDFGYICKLLFF